MNIKLTFKWALGISLFTFTSILKAQTPNWAENVAPILYTNCTGCHISGGIAPVSYVGYTQAKNYSYSIKNAVESRSMPPWPADPKYRRYAHEKLLSVEEIKTITDWVNAGSPEGDKSKAPADPQPKKETSILNPDLKLKMVDYTVKTTTDEYRCFVIPTNLSVNKFLTEIEVVPGNLSVVHHVLVFHDTSKQPLALDNADPNPGYLGFGGTGSNSSKLIGVWVPGQDPFKMPPGMGILLEKGGYIILQVHYPPYVNNIVDSSKVYLKLTTTNLREVGIASALNHTAPSLQNGPLVIPANQIKSFNAKYTIPIDISVFAVAPHMHLVGSSIKAFGVMSPGDTNRLVNIPNWDFHWQRTYTFPKVQKLPKNMVLWANATYNNTSSNKLNPNNPPKLVSLGEGTADEMLLVYLWYTLYQSGDENIVIDAESPKNISSIVRVKGKTNVSAFPNPANENLHISGWLGDQSRTQIYIYNLNGAMVKTADATFEGNNITVPLNNLQAAIYFLRISDGNHQQTIRIVKD